MNRDMKYERKETYPLERVFEKVQQYSSVDRLLENGKKDWKWIRKANKERVDFDGDMMKMTSQRYALFKNSGCTCVMCGLEGTYFVKERHKGETSYHFNLYGIKPDGSEVMITKDHIVPVSKGGKDILINYQPMCIECNADKAGKQDPAVGLGDGTHIAFGWNFNGGQPNEIVVASITSGNKDGYIVHFAHGHHSIGEHVHYKNILAIGDPNGTVKISGWHGRFTVIRPFSKLILADADHEYYKQY